MNDYPEDIVALNLHVSDSYETTWTNSRASSYGVSGIPDVRIDGTYTHIGAGSDQAAYNAYHASMNNRLATPTDVTIELTVDKVASQTYRVNAVVGIDPGGVGKTMIVHFVRVLDYFPSAGDNRYRNCVRAHSQSTITVSPGGTKLAQSGSFNITGVDWDRKDDVKFVVIVQQTGSGMREIYNARVIDMPPVLTGDVNGDGVVDLTDLALLLASYGLCDGDEGYEPMADFSGNGCVDLSDLSMLLASYTG